MTASPRISVILPVYNAAAFLRETVAAILKQTEGNFELLVINDGSTDNSEAVIKEFADSRIRYFYQVNSGLVATLNRGLAEARAPLIARIDADDICLPERFAKQAEWLDAHPATGLTGCFVTFINEQGLLSGEWPDDRSCYQADQIRRALPYRNVIAHPGIMARTAVLREYGYLSSQQHIEDYDCWLRILADGKVIDKVPEVLLLYRIHSQSITAQHIKKGNVFIKQFHCKRRFLARRISNGKFNSFDLAVTMGAALDLFTGIAKWIKQRW